VSVDIENGSDHCHDQRDSPCALPENECGRADHDERRQQVGPIPGAAPDERGKLVKDEDRQRKSEQRRT
jgi:hypothetical protein